MIRNALLIVSNRYRVVYVSLPCFGILIARKTYNKHKCVVSDCKGTAPWSNNQHLILESKKMKNNFLLGTMALILCIFSMDANAQL